MHKLPLVVKAFTANKLVAVVFCPRMLRFLQLPAYPVPTHFRFHCAKPVIKHSRLQLETHPKPDRLIIQSGEEGEHIVPSLKTALEVVDLAFGPENGVVQLDRVGKLPIIGDNNF